MIFIILRLAIIGFIIFCLVGIIFSLFKILPALPGDIYYLKENFTFNFPIITCAILSGILTAILFITKKI